MESKPEAAVVANHKITITTTNNSNSTIRDAVQQQYANEDLSSVQNPSITEHFAKEPVFDGTEDATSGAGTGHWRTFGALEMAAKGVDWPERAAAFKNFVRERGVDVSNALRKLSAKMEDLDREVFEKGFDYMTIADRIRSKEDPEPNHEDLRTLKTDHCSGRITFFSTSGCEDCSAVRQLLRRKALPFVEINVDIYPHRKLELEERTGTSSLPQVFFNENFIGGIVELKAMETSRELDEKLKQVFENECPPSAPLPPVAGEGNDNLNLRRDELAELAQTLKERVQIKDRIYKMHWFTRCFVGSEAVSVLAEDQNCSREEAVQIGQKIASKLFFYDVFRENKFEDDNHLYRFLDHDPVVMSYCFNFNGKMLNDLEPIKIKEAEIRLRTITQAIYEQYVTDDGRDVDYQGICKSEEFKRYLYLIHQFQRLDLREASRGEKNAFFINLYNAMVVHAVIVFGHPAGPLDRRSFFGDFQYLIGGNSYSLSAIHNGVLRANQRPPYNLLKAFGTKDNRLKVSLPEPYPLIHFALNHGTRSSPALNCYTATNIDSELRFATREFFRLGGVAIDSEAKTVYLDKIMHWYSADFGRSELDMLKWTVDYLEPTKAESLLELLEDDDIQIVYRSYDWSSNSLSR